MAIVEVDETARPIYVVTINRPEVKNAVDQDTAHALHDAFQRFDQSDDFAVAILRSSDGAFCAGADLKSMLDGDGRRKESGGNPLHNDMSAIAPMGVTRMQLSKPVIAAISGPAVAGGLELALWCDLRVADSSAYFGVLCRLRGVPLIDGGTIRLPRLIGLSAASDMILTGRVVRADEAKRLNLVNYLAGPGESAFDKAFEIARLLASHPQTCMRSDRLSMLNGIDTPSFQVAMQQEFALGMETLRSVDFGGAVDAFVKKKTKL
ncbi:enoyl-CoA hydratase/isomerase [Dissoconium aciculare CBS 342.82]|uniref:Enoyl-CoA hydratase/isomerase n=1 Tax=Dissoconium aciculare CBS 342.82 TaxID=1314786 RepID=A0A6J3MBZ6_9PEZI|nr:enoyl-CoA hydratase/isomerase [Dissoconium aciculare CBS 342.82]KAF1825530.1 enoyl-CoA hydratase/isomerase [Dissoconium aciculare CBS 342.82]